MKPWVCVRPWGVDIKTWATFLMSYIVARRYAYRTAMRKESDAGLSSPSILVLLPCEIKHIS